MKFWKEFWMINLVMEDQIQDFKGFIPNINQKIINVVYKSDFSSYFLMMNGKSKENQFATSDIQFFKVINVKDSKKFINIPKPLRNDFKNMFEEKKISKPETKKDLKPILPKPQTKEEKPFQTWRNNLTHLEFDYQK